MEFVQKILIKSNVLSIAVHAWLVTERPLDVRIDYSPGSLKMMLRTHTPRLLAPGIFAIIQGITLNRADFFQERRARAISLRPLRRHAWHPRVVRSHVRKARDLEILSILPPNARDFELLTFRSPQTHVIFDSRDFPSHRRTWFFLTPGRDNFRPKHNQQDFTSVGYITMTQPNWHTTQK